VSDIIIIIDHSLTTIESAARLAAQHDELLESIYKMGVNLSNQFHK